MDAGPFVSGQNESVYVSAEAIAIVVSAGGLLLSMFGMFVGFASWIVKRVDKVEHRLGARIDNVEHTLGERITGVERELVEVKVAVARLEGPRPRLVPAR